MQLNNPKAHGQSHDFSVKIATHWGIPHVETHLYDLHRGHQYIIYIHMS